QHADGSISPLVGERRPPLGIEAFPAVASKATLQPGEALVLFSDGLAEEPSSTRDGDRYGLERIEASIDAHGADPAAILADLVDWCERDHFDDDLTVLVIRRAAD
ncbi:MAG: SpoIIE family protein phosphatase, partial [Phycisphaeraceae bacterium]|nr:SpoIIE family protein phosphatase [Phycisphaeraceae bacterium]MCP4804891.1 SpoIIE family protein phosphatase [Pseudomonadota bacterium]